LERKLARRDQQFSVVIHCYRIIIFCYSIVVRCKLYGAERKGTQAFAPLLTTSPFSNELRQLHNGDVTDDVTSRSPTRIENTSDTNM